MRRDSRWCPLGAVVFARARRVVFGVLAFAQPPPHLPPPTAAEDALNAYTDQRGRLRPYDLSAVGNAPGGDGSDIGAYELNLPVLNIATLAGNIAVSWSTNETGFTLESAAQLASPTIWTAVPGLPPIVGSQYTVTTNIAAGKQFYRLTGP